MRTALIVEPGPAPLPAAGAPGALPRPDHVIRELPELLALLPPSGSPPR